MRALLTDVRPLRESADFRRLWVGQTVSQFGQQMTAVTVAIQVYALTGSTFSVGLVGICALVPLVAFGLYGGAVADVVDRRTLALLSSTGLWLLSMLLAAQALQPLDSSGYISADVVSMPLSRSRSMTIRTVRRQRAVGRWPMVESSADRSAAAIGGTGAPVGE